MKEEIEAARTQNPELPEPREIVSENQVKLVAWMVVKGSPIKFLINDIDYCKSDLDY